MTWRGAGMSLSVMAIVLGVAGCKSSTEPRDEDHFGIGNAGSFVTTGGAEITFIVDPIVDPFTNRMSFNAKGSPASGEFNFQGRVFGVVVHIHGDILCYSISGNKALVGGLINSGDQPALIGQEAMWVVEDNGEGGAVERDRVSVYTSGPRGSAQAYCISPAALAEDTIPIETGNVQVHF
jgi:hypothetical protein